MSMDLMALARRVDRHADEADARGHDVRAARLQQLAGALRVKNSATSRRLIRRTIHPT